MKESFSLEHIREIVHGIFAFQEKITERIFEGFDLIRIGPVEEHGTRGKYNMNISYPP